MKHTKRILRATRIRPPAMRHGTTAHYRMPVLEAAGGYAPPAGCPSWAGPAGLTSLVNTPAAEQMLVYHSSGFNVDNSVHQAWEQELNALGYPAQGNVRNIAISNGSECGPREDYP